MNFHRIWEMITRSPHLHANSSMVRAATNALTNKAEELENAIKPYSEAEDPLVMFMTDVFNRRNFGSGGTVGPSDGKTKLYP